MIKQIKPFLDYWGGWRTGLVLAAVVSLIAFLLRVVLAMLKIEIFDTAYTQAFFYSVCTFSIVLFFYSLFAHPQNEVQAGEFGPLKSLQKRMHWIALASFVSITCLTLLVTLKPNETTHALQLSPIDLATGGLLGVVGAVITLVGIQVYVFSERVASVDGAVRDAQVAVKTAEQHIHAELELFRGGMRDMADASVRALQHALHVGECLTAGDAQKVGARINFGSQPSHRI